jgi:glycosyltransferase involved in cell wall biosynthesis
MSILQKSESPLVTVGIPVYNDEKYLSAAIGDILAQTHCNLEIVISDNCSTDGTEDICRGYASRDARIRYVRQEYNLGQHGNFRYLLDSARGEYFMWAASDDRWHPEFIARMVGSLAGEPTAAVAFCPYSEIDERGVLLAGDYRFDFGGPSAARRIIKFHLEPSGRRDAFFYGLVRRSKAAKIELNKWWWLNKNIPMNLAYPVLSHILAAGNYHLVDSEKPLWFNRVHLNSKFRHSGELSSWSFLLANFSILLRKINQVYETEKAVVKGSGSFLTGVLVFPVVTIRCLCDYLLQTLLVILSGASRLKF